MIRRERLVDTFLEIVQIDSPSGEEEAMAVDMVSRLKALGLTVARDDYGNVIADNGGENPLLLSCHLDTVEPGRGIKPSIEGERIVSDGTTILGGDAKAGIAAILEALESVREDGASTAAIEVALTREEETGLTGAQKLDHSMLASEEAIVFDGEGPVSRITSGAPTYIGFEVEITGRAAHAGMEPEKGLSAIKVAAELISRLPQGRLDADTTFNVGNIEGGSTRNTVPEVARIVGEFRSQNIEGIDGLREQVAQAVGQVRNMYPEAVIDVNLHTDFEAYALTDEDPAVRRAVTALTGLGLTPQMLPSGGGTDGNVFRKRGMKSVVVGMADNGLHTVREYVNIPELVDAAHFCEAIIRA